MTDSIANKLDEGAMKLCLDKGLGNPLVLICALCCDEELYAAQVEYLKRGRRVLVFQSEGEESVGAAADELVAMLAAIGLRRTNLGGLSMGGYIAQEVVARRPFMIRRLLLLDTRATLDAPEARAGREEMIRQLENGQLEQVLDNFLPKLLSPQGMQDHREMVRAMMRRLGAGLFVRQLRMLLTRRDTLEAMKAHQGRTLVLVGGKDTLTSPQMHRELASAMPQADYVQIPGQVGHLSTIEAPQAVSEAIAEFLDAPEST